MKYIVFFLCCIIVLLNMFVFDDMIAAQIYVAALWVMAYTEQ